MSSPLDWDTSLGEQEKRPALQVGPIRGVLPYDGYRNPLTRSATTHRVSMTLATPATNGQRKLYHFDGQREMAVALEAVLSPELYHLEVQLPPLSFIDVNGKERSHSFDLRITFKDGYRRAVFVRNGKSLQKPQTQAQISAISQAISEPFADDMVVVNGDQYTRCYRDNLLRIWNATMSPDEQLDRHVLERSQQTSFWLIADLITACDCSKNAVLSSIQRLIGKGLLHVNLHAVIGKNSRIWLA